MKLKSFLFLLVFLLLIQSFTFKYNLLQSDWSSWQTSNCYSGLDYSTKKGSYDEGTKKYWWYIKFRNRYKENINFSYAMKDKSDANKRTNTSKSIKAGKESGSSSELLKENYVNVFIDNLRHGKDNWGKLSPCDNK